MASTPTTVVFYDSEGTGLPQTTNVPKFTEICFLAVSREELLRTYVAPRVVNKLNLCFNPQKPLNPSAVQVSGLTNDALEHCPTFKEQVPILMHFLKLLPQPVMLVAHNGRRYDFPLLARYLEDAGVKQSDLENIECADSVKVFQEMLPMRRLVLDEMHKQICGGGSLPSTGGTHSAETDSIKLMDIVRKKDPERFIRLCTEKAETLNSYTRPAAFNNMFTKKN